MHRIHLIKITHLTLLFLLLGSAAGCRQLPFSLPSSVEETSTAAGNSDEAPAAEAQSIAAAENPADEGSPESEAEPAIAAEDITPVNSYAFSQLSTAEQQVYREVLQGLRSGQETKLSTLEDDVLKQVFKYVLYDHPEIYDTDGFHYSSESVGESRLSLSLIPQYTLSREEKEATDVRLSEKLAEVLKNAPAGSDYEKALYAFDWVVENTDYAVDAANGQNVLSVFLDGQSVCNGYAKAFQLLLQKMDIPAVLVTGKAKNGSHAWVAACLDGAWSLFDPTWGEPGISNEAFSDIRFVNHSYFALTAADMNLDHEALGDLPLPDCSDESHSYFRQSGSYFTNCDMEGLRSCFRKAQEEGESAVQFRCEDSALREEFLHELLDNQMVYRFLNGQTRASYFVNEGLNVVTFLLNAEG